MIEGLKDASATRQNNHSLTGEPHQTIESVAIAGATAIQHLITERDSLRGRARAQEDELVGLRVAHEDLRHHLTLISRSLFRAGDWRGDGTESNRPILPGSTSDIS